MDFTQHIAYSRYLNVTLKSPEVLCSLTCNSMNGTKSKAQSNSQHCPHGSLHRVDIILQQRFFKRQTRVVTFLCTTSLCHPCVSPGNFQGLHSAVWFLRGLSKNSNSNLLSFIQD
jgi:hypothetical protein